MNRNELPPLRRTDYTEHATAAAKARMPHAEQEHGRITADIVRLEPFQKIQVAHDQLISQAETVRRGEPFPHDGGFNAYATDALAHMDRHATTLEVAAEAARNQYREIESSVKGLVTAMAKKHEDDHPKLTTDGGPHPLEEGDYDANSDAGKPSNESDVAALKAGHASQAQAEAIAKADLAHNDEQPGDPFAPDDDAKAKDKHAKPGHDKPASVAPPHAPKAPEKPKGK